MRDVTDNKTGELDVEVKRGRGRPRKEGALTNAERQAAYRARHRANPVTAPVTKTPQPIVAQVDAYDECRIEVDTLRAELDDADKILDRLTEEIAGYQKALRVKEAELAEAKKGAAKSVTPSNGNPVSFDDMVELILLASKARTFDQRLAIRADSAGVYWRAVVSSTDVSEAQMEALTWAVMAGKFASQVGV